MAPLLHRAAITSVEESRDMGVLLLHDNAPAHTSNVATSAVAECGYELLVHPPHSPDLAPSVFCLFPLLKKDFSDTQFSSDSDVIASVEVFLQGQDKLFYKAMVYKSCRNDGTRNVGQCPT